MTTSTNRNAVVRFDDTRFIYRTNFSGDPERDRFGSNRRQFNIVISSDQQAHDLEMAGVNVRWTQPNPNYTYEGEFISRPFVRVNVNLESKWPPEIYLIAPNGVKTLLTPETVGVLDSIRVKNVCCQAKMAEKKNQPGAYTLYAQYVYVEQAADPFPDPYANRYAAVPEGDTELAPASEDDMPF